MCVRTRVQEWLINIGSGMRISV
uniref:Uncharacterized protein n=1 Tax=Rhizophora mucronata TaxID=61149 RepID=A0A2P2R2Q8_RHIMU